MEVLDKKYAIENYADKQNIVLPAKFLKIKTSAFCGEDFKYLKEVSFEKGSTYSVIPFYCFMGCERLEKIDLPRGVLGIGESAFSGCEKLKEITLNDDLLVIKKYAFFGCKNLKEITLPMSLKVIEKKAFASCSLTKVYVSEDTKIEEGAFDKSCEIIPVHSKDKTREDDNLNLNKEPDNNNYNYNYIDR